MGTVTSRLIVALTDQVTGRARGIGGALARLRKQGEMTSGALMGTAGAFGGGLIRGALAMGASYYGVSKAIGGTVGSAIKFEEAFADVRKVVDGTPAQLQAVRADILGLSKDLPVTAEGLASIYAAAGQSGVALGELTKFSEMAAKVSVAWDTSQAETGDALAKIKTQLQMSVSELGLHADAINHLANNTASAANDLVDFDKRVAAVGKMFGFTDTQTLAFGASMISAGAQSEVAATSFRNMGRALTMGERATKAQRTAFSKLGLDAVKTAKGMQKNALATTLDVMDRIAKLPKWQQNSIASALFGDEARGLLPVIADSRELRRELGLVGNEANYAGSAFNEYLVRSQTTANALQLIGNKIKAVGIGIGDSWLPTIKDLGLGLGDVLDTLDKRVGVLDQVKSAFQGFMGGLGYGGSGGVREAVNDIGDLIFGKAFGGSLKDADDRVVGLARLSNRFRVIGHDLKAFADDILSGNIVSAAGHVGDAVKNLGGGLSVGGAIAIALTGRALIGLGQGAAALALSKTGRIFIMAMAVSTLIDAVKDAGSLGEFVDKLKGLETIEWVAIGAGLLMVAGRAMRAVKWFRTLAEVAPTATTGTTAAEAGAAGGGLLATLRGWLPGLGGALMGGVAAASLNAGQSSLFMTESEKERANFIREGLKQHFNSLPTQEHPWRKFFLGAAAEPGFSLRDQLSMNTGIGGRQGGPSEVNVVGVPEVSIPSAVTTQPSGTQDVRVTNPQPAPNITVNVTATQDPQAIAAAAVAAISARWSALTAGAHSDGAN